MPQRRGTKLIQVIRNYSQTAVVYPEEQLLSDVHASLLQEVSANLFTRAATRAAPDGIAALKRALGKERDPSARERLKVILRDIELGEELNRPICQTFATPGVYIRIGSGVRLEGDLYKAIKAGIEEATEGGYLRASIVDPISRVPVGGNVGRYIPNIDIDLMAGVEYLEMTAHCTTELPPSKVRIFYPQEAGEDCVNVKKFVIETVLQAGGVACPPMAVTVGIGGSLEIAAKLSKKASLGSWIDPNPDPKIARWEKELLDAVNKLGIGPFGLGGDTTAISVKVDLADTHAADLPVAVNLFCWACTMRKATARIIGDQVEYG